MSAEAVQTRFLRALEGADLRSRPYRHWLLQEALPDSTGAAVAELPIAAAPIGDTRGRRETHNSVREFFSPDRRRRLAVCDDVARAFQDPATVAAVEAACGAQLQGSYLRIEYCQDMDGFWLEPHTDIGAKRFTLLIYLSDGPQTAGWGTDVYDGARRPVARAPFGFSRGLAFVPGSDTWHGFEPRPLHGVRKSLIINYVGDEWRARHELAFPDQPVGP